MEPNMDFKQIMNSFIDKLCDHLGNERVKLLIDNGFDQWDIVALMKGQQLIQMNFLSEECIIIMVAINATAKQFKLPEIFNQTQMKRIIQIAKEADQRNLKQSQHSKSQNPQNKHAINQADSIEIKQYPKKQINEALIWKGTTVKKGQKLTSITMISLQQKGITHICQMDKIPALQILHLAHNHIYKIECLQHVPKLKTLKLQYNNISIMQGLQYLNLLQKLALNDNYIGKVQGLANNKNLHYLNISNQNIKHPMMFEQQSLYSLAYCLEKLQCDKNKIANIQNFKHLKVVHEVSLKGNNLQQIQQISQSLSSMQMLKKIDFRGNPIAKAHKYRDYIVILSKSLQQLDDKKILPTERQYLVKLYSLKHAHQSKQNQQKLKQKSKPDQKHMDLQGQKFNEDNFVSHQFYQGNDFSGNIPYQNTKNQSIPKK